MKTKILKFIKDPYFITILFLIIISLSIRIWQLGKINEFIFDEVYFVKFAQNYLNRVDFFDIHPPLGKLIIALGIKIFGDNPFGWRIMPAIFGTLLIPLGYLTGKEISSSKRAGLIVAAILALDGMILVYSRIGLIDIFLSFFILLGFYLFLKYANTRKLLYMILAGISLGLAASVKYIGGLGFFVFVLIILVKKIPLKVTLLKFIIFLVLVPLAIYFSFFLFDFSVKNLFSQIYQWHNQSFSYNIFLEEGHPYASKWWSWFLLLRPIWFYFKDIDGRLYGIDGIGNPLAWWSSIVIIPLLIWGAYQRYRLKASSYWKAQNDLIILGSFLIFLLFWAPFKRVLFFYHALPAFLFLALGLGLWWERAFNSLKGKYFFWGFLGFLVVLFIYFLPIWLALPLETNDFYRRIWLKGWI